VARLQLRRLLRTTREQAAVTQQMVTRLMDWSPSKIIRIENGFSPVGTSDLRALLTHYGVTNEAEVAAFVELARAARGPGIADRYRHVLSKQLAMWIEYEASAQTIRWYQATLVPAILQTADYATAVLDRFMDPPGEGEEAEWRARRDNLVAARMDRGQQATVPEGPAIEVILDEAVLHREAGPGIRRRQLEHIRRINTVGRAEAGESISDELNLAVSVRYVPFGLGVGGLLQHPFELLEISDNDEHLVYLENGSDSEIKRDEVKETAPYFDAFLDLSKVLPTPGETNAHLDRLMETEPA
jgi:hypothetical protein